jgi:3',5'-cyclic AMP phosphodiesterase CpdA
LLLNSAKISDLHVSKFVKEGGIHNLQRFLNDSLPTIKPRFVVVTGDLTDAKDEWKLTSLQHQEEWEMYKEALENSNVTSKDDFWFDLRGNHDCYDVPNDKSTTNFFATHSQSRDMNFLKRFDYSFGNYSIVAVDAWYVGLDSIL